WVGDKKVTGVGGVGGFGCAGGRGGGQRGDYGNALTDQIRRNSGNVASFPSAQRNSMATFFPSTKPASPKPLRNPARRLAFGSGEPECRNPITGMADCCARATSGRASAAPPSVKNSRRFILRPF